MDAFATLFTAFGLASAAGFNAYLPLLAVGLAGRYTGMLHLAAPFDVLANPWVLAAVAVLAVVDFIADKIPAVDHAWHVGGLVVAPLAGAILFASQHNILTDVHPLLAVFAGLVIAGGFQSGRTAVRPLATTATGGVMNPVLSILEDFTAAGLSLFAIFIPGLAAILVLTLAGAVVFVGLKAVKHLRGAREGRRDRP